MASGVKTKTISAGGNVTLTSYWKVERIPNLDANNPLPSRGVRGPVDPYTDKVTYGPTTSTGSFIFDIAKNIPSGSTVVGIEFSCHVGANSNGGSITVGGSSSGWNTDVTRSIVAGNGVTSVTLTFKANGNTSSLGGHSASVTFSSGQVVVSYKEPASSSAGSSSGGSSGSGSGSGGSGGSGSGGGSSGSYPANRKKMFYVHDKSKGKTYRFDGVIKASHAMALKLEEDVSEAKDKESYVNNAKNEPNQITFEVMMSDVYTDKNDLTKAKKNRSESSVAVLRELKESRRKVDVYTNLTVYKDMLLADFQITQDDTDHFGWYGSLGFQEAYEQVVASETSTTTSTGSSQDPINTPSMAAQGKT